MVLLADTPRHTGQSCCLPASSLQEESWEGQPCLLFSIVSSIQGALSKHCMNKRMNILFWGRSWRTTKAEDNKLSSCYSNAHIGTIFVYTCSPLQDLEMLFSLLFPFHILLTPGPQPENKLPYSPGSTAWWGPAWLLGCTSQCPVCWAPALARTSDHWFPLRPVQIGLWVIQRQTTFWAGTHGVWVCGFLIHRGALFRGGPPCS